MKSFYTKEDGEIYYYKLRERSGPDTIFVSKVTEFKNNVTGEKTSKRNIRKVFGGAESCEIVRVKGEFILRCSPKGRDQIKVIVHDNDNEKIGFVLQKFRGDTGNPIKETNFSFYDNEFSELLEFLNLVKFIDLSDKSNFKAMFALSVEFLKVSVFSIGYQYSKILLKVIHINCSKDLIIFSTLNANIANFKLSLSGLKQKILVSRDEKQLIESFKSLQGEDRLRLLEQIRDERLTKQDLDILSGRKDGLALFHRKLYVDKDWSETKWQAFFENNTWIFGYGLDYRFLSILQREAAVSNSDIDGKNTTNSDFLLGSTDFTVLVEMKRPDTQLFESTKNRSRSWKLSKYLVEAVSQILAQKASWEIKSTQDCFNSDGNLIDHRTSDPKCILIIGSREQFDDNTRDQDIKFRTFELFRRNSRNTEILTYDELYERAYYIVNQELPPPFSR